MAEFFFWLVVTMFLWYAVSEFRRSIVALIERNHKSMEMETIDE
jgi:hypothetical protein